MAEVIATFAALSSFMQVLDFTTKIISLTHDLVTGKDLTKTEDRHAEQLSKDLEGVLQLGNELSNLKLGDENSGVSQLAGGIQAIKLQCQQEGLRLTKKIRALEVLCDQKLGEDERKGYKTLRQKLQESARGFENWKIFQADTRSYKRLYHKAVLITFKAPKLRQEIREQRRHLQELNGLLGTALL